MTNSSANGDKTRASSVLDASALLAVVLNEPGAEVVRDYLRAGTAISSINLAEVVSRLARLGFSNAATRTALTEITFDIIELSAQTAWSAGRLVDQTSAYGLSIGDRCCIALARELGLPVLTADRVWAQLDLGIEVVVCR